MPRIAAENGVGGATSARTSIVQFGEQTPIVPGEQGVEGESPHSQGVLPRGASDLAVLPSMTVPYQSLADQAARGRISRAMAFPFSMRVFVRSCMACRFIQNSGLVSKKRARRKAVSAVTE